MKVLDAYNFYDENLSPAENMINFAKQHVEAALIAVGKDLDNHGARYEWGDYVELSDIKDEYPLTNIK